MTATPSGWYNLKVIVLILYGTPPSLKEAIHSAMSVTILLAVIVIALLVRRMIQDAEIMRDWTSIMFRFAACLLRFSRKRFLGILAALVLPTAVVTGKWLIFYGSLPSVGDAVRSALGTTIVVGSFVVAILVRSIIQDAAIMRERISARGMALKEWKTLAPMQRWEIISSDV